MVSHSRPYRLLIADDDPAFRDTLLEVFEPHRGVVETLVADSGEQAVELVDRETVDLALLDMHMRQLTGLQTLRLLRARQLEFPCILITAEATEELRRDAIRAHAWRVLGKPVSRRDLLTAVAGAIQEAYAEPDALHWFD